MVDDRLVGPLTSEGHANLRSAFKFGSDSLLMKFKRPLALVSHLMQRVLRPSALVPRRFNVESAVYDGDATLITVRPTSDDASARMPDA